MIQVKTYQQQVTPAQMPVASPTPAKVPADAFGVGLAEAGERVGKVVSDAGTLLAAHAIKKQEQLDNAAVLATDSKMQKELQDLLYNPDGGLLLKQGLDAKDASKTFDSKAQEIFQKHLFTLPSQNQQQAATRLFDSHALALRGQVIPHEAKEVRAGNLAVLEKNIQGSLSVLANNPLNPGNVEAALGIMEARKPEITALLGNDGYNNLVTKQASAFGLATIKALAESGNIGAANEILEKHKEKFSPAMVAEARAIVTGKKDTFDSFSIVEKMDKDPAFRNPDGTINLAKGIEHITKTYGPGSVGKPGSVSFESFVKALVGQESGGNYDAKNGRTGAAGKYQIMPENWSVWASEAGLSPDAPMSPENQDKVATAKLKKYYDQYGARGAAIAWYAGPDAINWSEAALSRKQGNGDEPSINEYVSSVLGNAGSGGGSGFQPEKYAKLKVLWNDKVATAEKAKAQNIENVVTSIADAIRTEKPQTQQERIAIVDRYGLSGGDYIKALTYANAASGQLTVKTDPYAMSEARIAIGSGMPFSQVQLDYSDRISPKDFGPLQNYETLYKKGLITKTVDDMWKSAKLDTKENSALEGQVLEKVMSEVKGWSEKPENKGKQITSTDVAQIFQKQIEKTILVNNTFSRNEKGTLAQVPYWMQIDSESPHIVINGIKVRPTEYDKKSRRWYTTYKGQKVEMVDGGLLPLK